MKKIALLVAMMFGMSAVYAAEPAKKEAPKKVEQKKAPEKKKETPPVAKVAPEIKKPEKKRDAPKDVQKKAADANAKK